MAAPRRKERLSYHEVDALMKFGNAGFSMQSAQEFNRWVTARLGVRAVRIVTEPSLPFGYWGEHRGHEIVLSWNAMQKMDNRAKWALVVHEVAHYRVGRHCYGRPHPPEFKVEQRLIHSLWWEWALANDIPGVRKKRRAKKETPQVPVVAADI